METTRAAEFVEENLKTIFAYALSRVSDKNDAEDLTNDIVLAILQNAEKLKDPNAFYGYVWGIAANTYRKFMRKKERASKEIGMISLASAESNPDASAPCVKGMVIDENTLSDGTDFTEDLLLKEDCIRLRREIALLSKEYRECTVAYYFDELSCAEISKKQKISPEMVKYYLFKTRKILKEGISMEREFGEKSFNPTPFDFRTIFAGEFNREYHNLFTGRKLPGQILMSAYYMPMSIRELAIELGVASVYLEDEIALLERYNLLSKTAGDKYLTKLIIFTEDYTKEFHRKAEKIVKPVMAEIFDSLRGKLEKVRALNEICRKLPDARLLWALLWPLVHKGKALFDEKHEEFLEMDTLYGSAHGINYGVTHDEEISEYGMISCAGFAGIDKTYQACGVDLSIVPACNHFFSLDRTTFAEKIYDTVSGKQEPEFMILSVAQEQQLYEILTPEMSTVAALYEKLFCCSCELMRSHAPKTVEDRIEHILFHTLFFRTLGLIGGCAVKSGALELPEFDGPAAMYVRERGETTIPMTLTSK